MTVEILAERYNILLPQFDQPIDDSKREGIGVQTNNILDNSENNDNGAISNEGAIDIENSKEKEECAERPLSAEIFESDHESDDFDSDVDIHESDHNSASVKSCDDINENTGETNLKAESINIDVPVLKSQNIPPRLFELDSYFNPTGSGDNQPTSTQKYDENIQELYLPQPWASGAQATFQPIPDQNESGQKLYLPQPWAEQASVDTWEEGATASTLESESSKKELELVY